MPSFRLAATALALLLALAPALHAQGFRFSDPDPVDEEEHEARVASQARIAEQQANGYIAAEQRNYGPHYRAINSRLRALGLRTYTPEEIRRQIAQAEIDAQFRHDPDAALSASKRLGASFLLRGLISSHATPNPMIAVNQVSVD